MQVGRWVFENNMWGVDKANGIAQQCLVERVADKKVGWTFNFEGCDDSIFSYPEVIVGAKSWSDMANTHPGLVTTVDGYHTLSVELETETVNYAGSFNLALEGWTTKAPHTGKAIPDDITSEVGWGTCAAARQSSSAAAALHILTGGIE